VANTGSVSAETVAQLYIHQRAGSASRPIRELKGFKKIAIQRGASQTVHFTLGKEELMYYSTASHSWVFDPGTFDVWVGGDSTAALHTEIELQR
jgi:beta-glucosidase